MTNYLDNPGSEGLVARVRGLRIRSQHAEIIRGVSFDVAPGRCVAIVGESGSGKTQITRSLIGLSGAGLSVEADELMLGGRDIRRLGEEEWRRLRGRSVGLVSQDALLSLDPLRRAHKEVAEPLVVHPVARGDVSIVRAVDDLLRRVHLPDPAIQGHAYPHQLSGGMRQRVLIAQGIAAAPRLLIADEPTTALDSTVQTHILALLRELVEGGMGLLLVSHNLGLVRHIADDLLVLHAGEVVERGHPAVLLAKPQHPHTRQLVAAIPRASAPVLTETVAEPRLIVDGVSKTYQRGGAEPVHAVRRVSCVVHPGTTLGVVGESGSGKSTLSRLIMGVEPPDQGTVTCDGTLWSGISERHRQKLRGRIQLIHQDPYSALNPERTVGWSVSEALRIPRRERSVRVAELMTRVGLDPGLARHRPGELSGGQRQRVAIARALATDPSILVCDEAVSALDMSVQADIVALLRSLQAVSGLAIVFISHDLNVVREMSHRLIVMHRGEVVEEGLTETVLGHPRHPFTRELLASAAHLADAAAGGQSRPVN
ncbi:ABC transporter ATP-binding protein [Klugiella xanthotipulae]|uniref:Peptide/nickel transport system ATP-binding protein n=1 Tax=Klugiella xanthotipulae TaxID=244735 RepID=A0A543HSS1_9MICO|nr:ABC transporter ATP-binding protein [Klugiella xanthotipulae]TQM61304.1 peptide/nickel transport system ATP-binding protein [Klugiella xanthotipulae]